MQIPQELPQFSGTRAVIITSGATAGKVYVAADGMIELVHAYEEPPPGYSDNEGHFARKSQGIELGSGAPREIDKTPQVKRYVTELVSGLTTMERASDIEEVYLMAPAYVLPTLQKALTRELSDLLVSSHSGNFLNAHPTEFLKRLSDTEA